MDFYECYTVRETFEMSVGCKDLKSLSLCFIGPDVQDEEPRKIFNTLGINCTPNLDCLSLCFNKCSLFWDGSLFEWAEEVVEKKSGFSLCCESLELVIKGSSIGSKSFFSFLKAIDDEDLKYLTISVGAAALPFHEQPPEKALSFPQLGKLTLRGNGELINLFATFNYPSVSELDLKATCGDPAIKLNFNDFFK